MSKFSNYPQTVDVKVGTSQRSTFNFDHLNITTLDFGRIKPIFAREVLPTDTINMSVELFSRASPLGQPSYTQIKHRMYAFFVPARLLQSDWNDFINGQSAPDEHGSVSIPSVNCIPQYQLMHALSQPRFANEVSEYTDLDFSTTTLASTPTEKHFAFNKLGTYAFDMFKTFGFDIGHSTLDLNISKFIAYQRIYEEWFRPSSYALEASAVSRTFATQKGRRFNVIDSDGVVTDDMSVITHLLEPRFCCFDRNYFGSAWQTPTGNYIAANNGRKTSPEQQPQVITNNGIPALSSATNITQQALEVLRGVTNWFRRKSLAGSRYYENILAQFGEVPDDARLDRSELISTAEGYVSIGDVTSTADTNLGIPGSTGGTSLGSYVGKAVYSSDANQQDILNVNYTAQEHGYIIIVSTLLPDCDVVTGTHRENMHTRLNDFFQPELETIGTQAISLAELLSCGHNALPFAALNANNMHNQIWGFVPNYSEYKHQRQLVTGNFALPRFNNLTISNWHTQRELYPYRVDDTHRLSQIEEGTGNGSSVVYPPYITRPFMEVDLAKTKSFDRIFQVQDANNADHFQANYIFRANWTRPMGSLTHALNLDGGREVSMQYNGIQL